MAIYLYTCLDHFKACFTVDDRANKFYFFDEPSKQWPESSRVHEIEDVTFGYRDHPQLEETVRKVTTPARQVADKLLERYGGKGLIEIAGSVPTPEDIERSKAAVEAGFKECLFNFHLQEENHKQRDIPPPRPSAWERKALDWEKLNQAKEKKQEAVDTVALLARQQENQQKQTELLTALVTELVQERREAKQQFGPPPPPPPHSTPKPLVDLSRKP